MEGCLLCPRACNVDRSVTTGYCGAGLFPCISKVMLHLWEEPFLSGTRGSGAVFFSGCNLGCVYCQNYRIRGGGVGESFHAEALAKLYLRLQEEGAHNVNLVTAAPYVPVVADSLARAKLYGLKIPVVYNSSGYELVDTIRLLDGLVDIYLPDWKYVSPVLSAKFSSAPDYSEVASKAIFEMYRQVGDLRLNDSGLAVSGLAIRHLVLPGCVDDTRRVLDRIVTQYGKSAFLSLMSQYTPQPGVTIQPLDRRLTKREYERTISYALSIGLYNILIQEMDSAKPAYTPDFTDKIKI